MNKLLKRSPWHPSRVTLVGAAPFFVLAFVAKRWPRTAGVLLLAASIALMFFFGWHDFANPELVTQLLVMLLFLGPLVGNGIALLRPGVVERSTGEYRAARS